MHYETYVERKNQALQKIVDKWGMLYYAALTFLAAICFLWLGCVWAPEFLSIGVIFGIAALVLDLVFVADWFIKRRKSKVISVSGRYPFAKPLYDEHGNIIGYRKF